MDSLGLGNAKADRASVIFKRDFVQEFVAEKLAACASY